MSEKEQKPSYLPTFAVIALVLAIAIQIVEKNGIVGDENGVELFTTPFGVIGIVCFLSSIACAYISRNRLLSKVLLCVQVVIIVLSAIGLATFQMVQWWNLV